jgi:hypothetical protein
LTIIAELPLQTGIEVQGKSIKVAFDFLAIGHEEQIPIGSNVLNHHLAIVILPFITNRSFLLNSI